MKLRILLTGGGGMVGRNFLEHPALGAFEVLAPRSSELDLLDYNAVLTYLREHAPDMVIHAAGKVGGIQANMREPVHFLLDNLDIGRNIVWAAHEAGTRDTDQHCERDRLHGLAPEAAERGRNEAGVTHRTPAPGVGTAALLGGVPEGDGVSMTTGSAGRSAFFSKPEVAKNSLPR